MSESNYVFTIDNRVISYSVYEQALKEIEALKEENDVLQDKVYHATRKVEEQAQEIAALKEENQKLKAALSEAAYDLNPWTHIDEILSLKVKIDALIGKE